MCDPLVSSDTYEFAMSDWRKTNSPIVYWSKQISDEQYLNRAETLDILETMVKMTYDLPAEEARRVCKSRLR